MNNFKTRTYSIILLLFSALQSGVAIFCIAYGIWGFDFGIGFKNAYSFYASGATTLLVLCVIDKYLRDYLGVLTIFVDMILSPFRFFAQLVTTILLLLDKISFRRGYYDQYSKLNTFVYLLCTINKDNLYPVEKKKKRKYFAGQMDGVTQGSRSKVGSEMDRIASRYSRNHTLSAAGCTFSVNFTVYASTSGNSITFTIYGKVHGTNKFSEDREVYAAKDAIHSEVSSLKSAILDDAKSACREYAKEECSIFVGVGDISVCS